MRQEGYDCVKHDHASKTYRQISYNLTGNTQWIIIQKHDSVISVINIGFIIAYKSILFNIYDNPIARKRANTQDFSSCMFALIIDFWNVSCNPSFCSTHLRCAETNHGRNGISRLEIRNFFRERTSRSFRG
jgi:hypothetical protein